MPVPSCLRLPLVTVLLAAVSPALACGVDTDCPLPGGHSYRIQLPEGVDPAGPKGALLFAHGYRGSSRGTMRNRNLRNMAEDLGVALIALDAKMDDWSLDNAPGESTDDSVDEMAYLDAVLADAARFGIAPERSVMTGFSAGGMMTWTVACARGGALAGYVPMSGTFWAPVPDNCPVIPASLIHLHGTADKIVPLAGRAIANTRQGDVPTALAMWAEHGKFAPDGTQTHDDLTCEQSASPAGQRLEFCRFDGGHSFRIKDLRGALARLAPPGW